MPNPPPTWVRALKPAEPQGTQLLTQERAQSNIDVDKLGELLHTKEALEKQDALLAVLKSEKIFDKSQNHTLGRTEKIQLALARGKRLQQLKKVHNWSDMDAHVAGELIAEPTPYGLHASMFLVWPLTPFGSRG
jgi:acyl-CoA oxidase